LPMLPRRGLNRIQNMKRYLIYVIYFLVGSTLLCAFSTFQKIQIGFPLYLKGYLVPFFVGGIAMILIGKYALVSKEKQSKILEVEKNYRYLFESAPDGIDILDENGIILDCNDAELRLTGYEREEIVGKYIYQLMPEKFNMLFKKQFPELKNMHQHEGRVKFICKHEEGIDIWRKTVSLVDSRGKFIGVLGFNRDISSLEMMERERKRLEMAIEQAGETVVITDEKANIQYINPAFSQISGYSREDATGQNPKILQSGQHSRAFYMNMWDTLTSGKIWKGHFINKKKDGRIYHEEATISPVIDENGKTTNYIAVKRDVTSEIELESQLRQSQKMEAIGTLASGIAHDFNNILFPIMGYAEMTVDDLPEHSRARKNLTEILKAITRAKDLVQQILTFSRQNEQELKPLKAQLVVKEALKLIRSSIPATIEIDQDIEKDCAPIMADPTKIHQVVMNLCTNAYHAMEEKGGRLNVRLKEVELTTEDVTGIDIAPGPYLCLTVSDTGQGIDQFIINRIFDPYFTSKEKGKGTGLGLAVVHGIVKNCGGNIRLYSEPGRGSLFNVYLPVIKTVMYTSSEIASDKPLQTGHEHILLVDDEAQIVDMEKVMLERLGYDVTTRTSSTDALEALKASPDKFDLVITDMTMPNMTGDELAGECKAIRKDIPFILCTGFSEKISEERANVLGIMGFLMKPFVMRDLARTIREVLD